MTIIETKEKTQDMGKLPSTPKMPKCSLKPRKKRTPLNKQKRIGIRKKKGYHYHLVNDIGDRISQFHEAGYELVEGEAREGEKAAQDASQLGKYASQAVGNGVTAYYMCIPEEYYKEDQAAKQALVDETDQMIGIDKIGREAARGTVKIDHEFIEKK